MKKYSGVVNVLIIYIVICLLLFIQAGGVRVTASTDQANSLLDTIAYHKETGNQVDTLLIWNDDDDTSVLAHSEYEAIFYELRVNDTDINIQDEALPDLHDYRKVVIATTDISALGEDMLTLRQWVGEGGQLLLGVTPSRSGGFDTISEALGIQEVGNRFIQVDDFTSTDDFMLGAGTTYQIENSYESSLEVRLSDTATVYASATNGSGSLPLIWSNDYKDGRFVVCNFGYLDKEYRGIFASAFSLLDEAFVYPVINGSAYYLDRFPSPEAGGYNSYIQRDYGMTIDEFYSEVWWPDMEALGNAHNISYTGMMIESYENENVSDYETNDKTGNYLYYGNMILDDDGELGYQGYNSLPLVVDEDDYTENETYAVFENADKIRESLRELESFSESLFPDVTMQVYAPPANILSEEGRAILSEDGFHIKVIASGYLSSGEDSYVQDFDVAEDGIVETPRIISGGILGDSMRFAAFSELNYHYVNSHYLYSDDVLDEYRGGSLGWKVLSENLSDYMDWLDESAPDIQHLTGTSMAGAVQRFVNVKPEVSISDQQITISLEGREDTAYFFLRLNDGQTKNITGGTLTQLNDSLYLVTANEDQVVIERSGA